MNPPAPPAAVVKGLLRTSSRRLEQFEDGDPVRVGDGQRLNAELLLPLESLELLGRPIYVGVRQLHDAGADRSTWLLKLDPTPLSKAGETLPATTISYDFVLAVGNQAKDYGALGAREHRHLVDDVLYASGRAGAAAS